MGLEKNEKFGLLGFNGSGKTTTFKTITNEEIMNRGKVTALGKDVVHDINILKNEIGYCPQSNALFDSLTVEEMVKYYKNIKETDVSIIYLFYIIA